MLIDTHSHLGDQQFDEDRHAVIERAKEVGVAHMIVVADSLESAAISFEVARESGMSATAGVHPHEATSWNADSGAKVAEFLERSEVVAVGEIGLDYHYDFSPRDVQRRVFREQLAIAAETRMPAVVHSREADEDMSRMVKETKATLILHSFSSGDDVLDAAIEGGHYVSFSGMVTFRSWKNTEAIRRVPADRLLVETDSPYLAPVPHRGKRNEPAFVVEVARKVAEIREVAVEEIIDTTTNNAVRLFGDRLTRNEP
jgi:TatD DNase family protein